MNFEKFELLISKLEALKDSAYDHQHWRTKTAEAPVCALGWMVRWGWIKKDTRLIEALENAKVLFGISSKESNYLFSYCYLKDKQIGAVPRSEIIKAYKQFLEYKREEYNRWYNKLKRAWRKLIC